MKTPIFSICVIASAAKQSQYFFILITFLITSVIGPMPQAKADELRLPAPGVMVHLSPEFTPALLKGITIHPENALMFDFIIQKGDRSLSDQQKQDEYKKLIKYFLASLAIPDEDQWVNLSPYENNRIIKDDFGKTEMGRDLLAQDYILKQITASLIYPEDGIGKKFWDKVYTQAQQQFGTTDIPVNTFNKVWIVPDDALIYEKGNTAYVIKNHLKVMLEEDYLSLSKHAGITDVQPDQGKDVNKIGGQVVREIILPSLEKEVNEGKNFAPLRQVYSGMILAAWYKRVLKESLLGKIYANKAKVKGVDQNPQNNEEIYHRYLRAYKKGVFNYIKEDVDKFTNETIPRKYFSGGTVGEGQVFDKAVVVTRNPQIGDVAMNADAATEDIAIVKAAEPPEALNSVSSAREGNITTPAIDTGSNLVLPLVTDAEVLRLSQLAAIEGPPILGKNYTPQNSPRMQLRNLRVDKPGLTPQIMAAFVNLPGAENDPGVASDIRGLVRSRITGKQLPHTSLMLVALAALALKGNANAAGTLMHVFKEDELPNDVMNALNQAINQDNKNALYALGMLFINNGHIIVNRLDDTQIETVIKVLSENGLKGDGENEAKALESIAMYALEKPKIQQMAFKSLEQLAENGSAEAAYHVIENVDSMIDFSNKARLISHAERSIIKIRGIFSKSVADNQDVKKRAAQKEQFAKRIAPLIFKLAIQAEQEGSDLTSILENYGNWQEFNIFRPLIWPEFIRNHILNNRLANKLNQPLPSSSPGIAIVIYPKSDHNGAFSKSEPIAIRQLIDRGYSVMYYEVASPNEMVEAIKDATKDGKNPASFMLIGGHGTPDSIQFGNIGDEDAFLVSDHTILESGSLSRFFTQDAKGLLESCSTGGITTKEVNMVQAFANANGINVYGPDKNTSLVRINFDSLESSEFADANVVTASPVKEANNQLSKDLGGIDLNAANLNLQIKRDGRGVPLPISQQDLENIKIDGLVPVIIDIKPMSDVLN